MISTIQIFLINVFNISIALWLVCVSLKAYDTFKLKIFKRAWLVISIGSLFWFFGHLSLILGYKSIHYPFFTISIIMFSMGFLLVSKAAKILGGV